MVEPAPWSLEETLCDWHLHRASSPAVRAKLAKRRAKGARKAYSEDSPCLEP